MNFILSNKAAGLLRLAPSEAVLEIRDVVLRLRVSTLTLARFGNQAPRNPSKGLNLVHFSKQGFRVSGS